MAVFLQYSDYKGLTSKFINFLKIPKIGIDFASP
jgi:hypothetical protein